MKKKLNKQQIIEYKKDQLILMFYIKIYKQVIVMYMYLVVMKEEEIHKINYYKKYLNL